MENRVNHEIPSDDANPESKKRPVVHTLAFPLSRHSRATAKAFSLLICRSKKPATTSPDNQRLKWQQNRQQTGNRPATFCSFSCRAIAKRRRIVFRRLKGCIKRAI